MCGCLDFVAKRQPQSRAGICTGLDLAEAKASHNKGISRWLYYYKEKLKVPYAFQIGFDLPFIDQDCFTINDPVIVPAKTFLHPNHFKIWYISISLIFSKSSQRILVAYGSLSFYD